MYELIIFVAGFIFGLSVALAIFRYGMTYAEKFRYKIKENIPPEVTIKPFESDFNETD